MTKISRWQVEQEGWIKSIGVPFDKEHFRESPPGKRHAAFDYGAEIGEVHYDQHNPHSSAPDLVSHLWDWSPIGTLALGYLTYKILKDL
jgi:hypothetical protein